MLSRRVWNGWTFAVVTCDSSCRRGMHEQFIRNIPHHTHAAVLTVHMFDLDGGHSHSVGLSDFDCSPQCVTHVLFTWIMWKLLRSTDCGGVGMVQTHGQLWPSCGAWTQERLFRCGWKEEFFSLVQTDDNVAATNLGRGLVGQGTENGHGDRRRHRLWRFPHTINLNMCWCSENIVFFFRRTGEDARVCMNCTKHVDFAKRHVVLGFCTWHTLLLRGEKVHRCLCISRACMSRAVPCAQHRVHPEFLFEVLEFAPLSVCSLPDTALVCTA